MTNLPLTAWEQGVILCLFIVFVGALLAWFGVQSDKIRIEHARQMDDIRASQAAQQKTWQAFIGDENTKWQKFLQDERAVYGQTRREDREKIDNLAVSLTRLAEIMSEFRGDFNAHVAGEDAKFDMMLDAKQKTELQAEIARKRNNKPARTQ